MGYYNVLLEYILPVFAGLIGFVLIIIQGRQRMKVRPDYYDTLVFTSVITAVSLLMFFFYTREILMGIYGAPVPVRVFDYLLYAAIPFTWLRFMEKQQDDFDSNRSSKAIFLAGKILSAAGAVAFVVITAFFMDYNYYISNSAAGSFYHVIEALFAIIMTLIILICAITSMSHVLITFTKRYILAESIVLTLYMLYQIKFTGSLGDTEIHGWDVRSADLSGWFLLAAMILTVAFIYKSDFQPLFVIDPADSKDRDTSDPVDIQKLALDTIADNHLLTVRERELIELIYKGFSNGAIAEELFISLSTVKTHVKNIFEKTGVSNRMELVYLINQQKDQLTH